MSELQGASQVVSFPRRIVTPDDLPEATQKPAELPSEEELVAEVGKRFATGKLRTVCPYCKRVSLWWKPTRTHRPFGLCSNCHLQILIKCDVSEDALMVQALAQLREEYSNG